MCSIEERSEEMDLTYSPEEEAFREEVVFAVGIKGIYSKQSGKTKF